MPVKKSSKEKFALLSVSNKAGITEFAKVLITNGYKIISTGGTAKVLKENKIPLIPIQEITGNPECFDGRMKTISFQIESALLYDRKKTAHLKEAKKLKIKPIDIVVCNLYPFEQIISKRVNPDEAIENIDVGGPTMVRAAAKNFKNILVIIDPSDYEQLGKAISQNKISDSLRQQLAAKAFSHLSFYDSQIAKYLNRNNFPNEITLPGRLNDVLRYGENPHQKAAFYIEPNSKMPMAHLKRLAGREPSLVNFMDINAGIKSVELFKEPTAVVIKHHAPCGIALGKTIGQALERAIQADAESAFGGVIVINRDIDKSIVEVIASFKSETKGNIDVIASPNINAKTLESLKVLRKSMAIYTFGKLNGGDKKNIKFVDGGFIIQSADNNIEQNFKNWKVVTTKKPTAAQLKQMKIAWKFITRIRSNTILVMDKDLPMTRGIGSGQTSRFRSAKIAFSQAGKNAKRAIMASDSFFPFDDSIKLAAKNKIAAIVQQGGSINDKVAIDTANKLGIPMIFTGRRAFWH